MVVGFFLFKFMLTYDFIQCIPDFAFAKLFLVATVCVSATNNSKGERKEAHKLLGSSDNVYAKTNEHEPIAKRQTSAQKNNKAAAAAQQKKQDRFQQYYKGMLNVWELRDQERKMLLLRLLFAVKESADV